MTILLMDGFDLYPNSTALSVRYPLTNNTAINTTAGRFGGGCVTGLQWPVNTTIPHRATVIVGWSVRPWDKNVDLIWLRNTTPSSLTTELSLKYTSMAHVELWRGTSTLLATSTATYANDAWHHIEMRATIADSGGSVEVRINGVTAISYSGDTRNSTSGTPGIDRIDWQGQSNHRLDDIYVLDTNTPGPVDFIGDTRISTLRPDSDVSTAWTRSTGTSNWSCVDEAPFNSDTDYVETAATGAVDRYGLTTLAATPQAINGAQMVAYARKTDTATRTFRANLHSGASTTNSATLGLSTSYLATVPVIASVDPATSAAWTKSAIDALQISVEAVL